MPLLTEAGVTGKPVTLRDANAAAEAWCAEVNAATHSEICAVPDERLMVERELLQPLPSLRLQIGAPSVLRKVDRLSCIRYGSARYSVPTRLIGTTVAVVVDHGALCLREPGTGVIVAEHELVAPGAVAILDDHYDGPRPTPSRAPRPPCARACNWPSAPAPLRWPSCTCPTTPATAAMPTSSAPPPCGTWWPHRPMPSSCTPGAFR